jgi:hypothetical protein
MASSRTQLTVFIVIIALAGLYSCTYTQNYTPELNEKEQSIADTINSKYHFDAINVNAKKTSGANGNHNVLLIEFINGVNIPGNETAEKALAKQLGKQVINAVKNLKQFDSYTIGFDTRTVSGAETTNNFYDFDFTPAEMNDK